MSRLARFTLITAAFTFLLVTVGGLVRATGSGLGCADHWPGCNGEIIPDFTNHHVVIEFSHRALASLVGFLTLGVFFGGWRRRKGDPIALRFGLVLLPLLGLQAWLGRVVVKEDLQAALVVAHLGGAMAFTGVLVALAMHLLLPAAREPVDRRMVRLSAAAAAAIFGLNVLGSYVTGQHAGLSYDDWPLMGGRVIPDGLEYLAPKLMFAHRVVAAVVGLFLLYVLREASRSGIRRVRTAAHAAAGLFGLQVLGGGVNIFTELHSAAVTLHLALSVAIWAALLVMWDLARRSPARLVERVPVADPGVAYGPPGRSKAMAFVALTKPRIIELLLVTTVPTMVIAKRGWPSTWLVVATVVGGTLAAGGANAVNMYVDRDIDRIMQRTQGRPLVTGEVTPRAALVFAIAIEAAAFLWLWALVNLLSAVLALSATLFYVFVYTLWLKRTSTQNIVIGGAAGAVPVLVGWSAVTGSLGLAPWVLFAIIFYWTPPHFWALAIKYRDDYAAAEVPMLPVVESLQVVGRKVLLYTLLLWAITLAFWPVAGMGDIYAAAAILLGGLFTWYAVQLRRSLTPQRAMRLFGYSISYITLLFGAMAVDRLLLA